MGLQTDNKSNRSSSIITTSTSTTTNTVHVMRRENNEVALESVLVQCLQKEKMNETKKGSVWLVGLFNRYMRIHHSPRQSLPAEP